LYDLRSLLLLLLLLLLQAGMAAREHAFQLALHDMLTWLDSGEAAHRHHVVMPAHYTHICMCLVCLCMPPMDSTTPHMFALITH
jgi:hypothetical protein